MDIIVVPHAAGSDRATVWVAALDVDRPPDGATIRLLPDGPALPLPPAGWRQVSADDCLPQSRRRVFVQTAAVGQLPPRFAGMVEVRAGEARAQARLTTLPSSLPGVGERPFTVLLVSCFAVHRDEEGRVGKTVAALPEAYRPDLTILCGDQVYLDIPVLETIPDTEAGLAEAFVRKYLRVWGQRGGFQSVLGAASCSFTADDHEFWNNSPNMATLIGNSWTAAGRKRWRRVALALYRDFQSENPALAGRPRRFDVGPLSFFVADTRIFRGEGDTTVLEPADFAALQSWVAQLRGPGVLVVGQPLMAGREGWFAKTFADRSLANYAQYGDLVRALSLAAQPVVILTGDVHYGRIARCDGFGGGGLVEVISSPASLVDDAVGGKSEEAPARFPAEPIAGLVRQPVETLYRTARENVATLQFHQRGPQVSMEVRYWFTRSPSGMLQSDAVGPLTLPLTSH